MINESPTRSPYELRSILASTDFSETAAHGVAAAARLAAFSGAKLHIVHAVDLSYTASTTIGLTKEFLDGLHSTALDRLEQVADGLSPSGLDVELHVRNGGAADALLETANEVDADLVVIGTHGRSGLVHTLLGSTAEAILQRTPRPVLSLHTADALPGPEPKAILIPTDLGTDAVLAMEGARRLLGATPGATRLTLLHTVELPAAYSRNVAAESWTRMVSELESAARGRLERIVEEIEEHGFSVRTVLRAGSPAAAILEEADARPYDAIAMRTAERSALGRMFLGSTARRIVQKASCPVLTLRFSGPNE